MPRATRIPATRRRKKKVLKRAKGFFGGRRKLYRTARETVTRAMAFATRDRKKKKRAFRVLWTIRINAAQPLFRGLRDFALVRQQNKNAEAVEFAKEQAKLQLFSDLAQAYYNVVMLEEDVRILKEQMDANGKRRKEENECKKE